MKFHVKSIITWSLALLLFFLLSNLFWPVRLLLGIAMDQMGYRDDNLAGPLHYATLHGEVRAHQDGVITFDGSWGNVLYKFKGYKECRPTSPDKVLYRLYALKPYQFWEYLNYFVQPQWQLPYLDPDQVLPPLNPRPPTLCPPESPDYPQPESYYRENHIPIPKGAPIL